MPAGIVETATSRVYNKGTKFYYARQATPSTFVQIAGVVEAQGPNHTREDVDATELDQAPTPLPSGDTEEMYYNKAYMPGDKDAQAITLTLNMKESQYAIFVLLHRLDELAQWKILYRNGGYHTWQGYIKDLGNAIGGASGGFVKVTLSIQPTSTVTYVNV